MNSVHIYFIEFFQTNTNILDEISIWLLAHTPDTMSKIFHKINSEKTEKNQQVFRRITFGNMFVVDDVQSVVRNTNSRLKIVRLH